MGTWELLAEQWPLDRLRDDAARLNRDLSLWSSYQLDTDGNPSFLVGTLNPKSRFLCISMNPRKNDDAAKAKRVRDALNVHTFAAYRRGAETYFSDDRRFNAEHYGPTAKLLSYVGRLPEPVGREAWRYFLHDYAVQVELVPFASSEADFSIDDVAAFHADYPSGAISAQLLASLAAQSPWDAILVRGLGTPWDFVSDYLDAAPHHWISKVGAVASVSVGGRVVRLVGLTSRGRVSESDLKRLGAAALDVGQQPSVG